MSVNDHYLSHVLACLARVAPVSFARRFGGVVLLHRERGFGLIVGQQVYFRTDELSRSAYIERGLEPLQPDTVEPGLQSSYYRLPEPVLETPAELHFWLRAAVEAAMGGAPDEGAEATPPAEPAQPLTDARAG